MFDLVGDIHGNLDLLKKLLQALGYYKTSSGYKHRNRKAIFVGDYIDRGEQSLECVQLVRDMVLSNQAIALAGNHEFNFLCYNKKDESDQYLRPHTSDNIKQVEYTLTSYEEYVDRKMDHLAWFQTLPIFYENEDIRVIHASWVPRDIEYMGSHYPDLQLSDQLVQKASEKGTREYSAIEHLLKGPEYELPEGISYLDAVGKKRTTMRIKWWESEEGKSVYDMAVIPLPEVPRTPFWDDRSFGYEPDEKPVFFGHYCLKTKPKILKPNVCCLDYCVYKTNRIVAYRWSGEKKLLQDNLWMIM